MNTDIRLLLTGGLTALAGFLHGGVDGNTVMAVGAMLVGGAVYRDVMTLAAQPVYLLTNRRPPGGQVLRGGLGAQNGSQPVSYDGDDPDCPYPRACRQWGCDQRCYRRTVTRPQGRSGPG